MRFGDVERALRKKASVEAIAGSKHGMLVVTVRGREVARVLVSRGSGEMTGREIGNCARSLELKEPQFRDLVACPMSAEQFADIVVPPDPSPKQS